MTDFKEPRTEIEWSRRAIINVVEVLQVHSESLTLVGAHAVLCFGRWSSTFRGCRPETVTSA